MSNVRVKYIGTADRFSEVSITGQQQVWQKGEAGFVSDMNAALLVASGQYALAGGAGNSALADTMRRLRQADRAGGYPMPVAPVTTATVTGDWTAANAPAQVAANAFAEQTFTVPAMQPGDVVIDVQPPSAMASMTATSFRWVSATQVAVMFRNTLGAPQTPPAGAWTVKVARFSGGLPMDAPLVTLSAQNAASTVGSAGSIKTLLANSGAIRIRGSYAFTTIGGVSNVYAAPNTSNYGAGGKGGYLNIVEFVTDAPKMDLLVSAWRAPMQVIVDGKIVTPAPIVTAYKLDAGYRLSIDFTQGGTLTAFARKPRKIRVELGGLCHFGGLTVAKADSVWPPSNPNSITSVAFGDSYTEANPANIMTNPLMSFGTTTYDGFANRLGDILGWDNHITSGVGSTGYVATGSAGSGLLKWRDRIDDIISRNPDVVTVVGSINDDNPLITLAQVQAEVTAFYTQLTAALPNALIFVAGPQCPLDAYAPNNGPLNATVKAGVAAVGSPNIFYIDTTSWISGTGKVGSTTGVGNSDVLTGSDGVHPSLAGHTFYAYRLAEEIRKIIKSYLA